LENPILFVSDNAGIPIPRQDLGKRGIGCPDPWLPLTRLELQLRNNPVKTGLASRPAASFLGVGSFWKKHDKAKPRQCDCQKTFHFVSLLRLGWVEVLKALSGPARRPPVEEGTAGVCGNEEDRVN